MDRVTPALYQDIGSWCRMRCFHQSVVDVAGIEPASGTFAYAEVAANHYHAHKIAVADW